MGIEERVIFRWISAINWKQIYVLYTLYTGRVSGYPLLPSTKEQLNNAAALQRSRNCMNIKELESSWGEELEGRDDEKQLGCRPWFVFIIPNQNYLFRVGSFLNQNTRPCACHWWTGYDNSRLFPMSEYLTLRAIVAIRRACHWMLPESGKCSSTCRSMKTGKFGSWAYAVSISSFLPRYETRSISAQIL